MLCSERDSLVYPWHITFSRYSFSFLSILVRCLFVRFVFISKEICIVKDIWISLQQSSYRGSSIVVDLYDEVGIGGGASGVAGGLIHPYSPKCLASSLSHPFSPKYVAPHLSLILTLLIVRRLLSPSHPQSLNHLIVQHHLSLIFISLLF